ncbi:MAG: DNA polymerase IV [Acidobacteriota bacterium]
MDRSVLYVDITAFPIAVERVVEPALVGRPVAVAPPGSGRAAILAASREAARDGVRPGMPVHAALRLCPGLRVLPTNPPLYRRAAGAVLSLLGGYSPLVEPAGAGRAFLDLTGTGRLFGQAKDAAARIRLEMEGRLRLRTTVGVATNKLVSRVAARVIRPDGLCDVFPGAEAPFLAPLPAALLPEADAPTRNRFAELGIVRVHDLLILSEPQMDIAFGWRGALLRRQALGIDHSPVRPPEASPAVAEEETLAEDSNDEAVLLRVVCGLCARAGERLRRLRAVPHRLRVTVRYAGAVTARREARLPVPTAADLPLFESARDLLDRARSRRERVRWIEVRCTDLLRGPRQLGLFGPGGLATMGRCCAARGDPARPPGRGGRRIDAAEAVARAVDRIRARFGREAVVPGRILMGRSGIS